MRGAPYTTLDEACGRVVSWQLATRPVNLARAAAEKDSGGRLPESERAELVQLRKETPSSRWSVTRPPVCQVFAGSVVAGVSAAVMIGKSSQAT